MRRILVAVIGLVACLTTAAEAQEARRLQADRVQVDLELLADGSLQVNEEITFRFSGRTFSEVERTVPSRRTDGLIDVQAFMDGQRLPEGRADNQVRISARRRELRVLWRFPDVTDTTRRFTLSFRAMGAARLDRERVSIAWHVLPTRHQYPISEAVIVWRVPPGVASLEGPELVADGWTWQRLDDGAWQARKAALAADETAVLSDAFRRTGFQMAPPHWQALEERSRELAPAFIVGAGVILVMGLGVIGMTRFRYPGPRIDTRVILPAERHALPPALGTAIMAGRHAVGLAQLSATLFDLFARGVLRLEETSRAGVKPSGRTFDLVLPPAGATSMPPLRPHEQVLLDTLWLHVKQGKVALKQAQPALVGAHRKFAKAVVGELTTSGLLDPDRREASRGLLMAGLIAVLAGIAGLLIVALGVPAAGDAGLLVPGAVIVLGVIFMAVSQTFPTLSPQGAVAGAQWAARAKALRALAKQGVSQADLDTWLPVAVGVGAGAAFAKSDAVASWLAGIREPGVVLPVLMAHGGGAYGSGAGVSAGGAGGGGFSGAR